VLTVSAAGGRIGRAATIARNWQFISVPLRQEWMEWADSAAGSETRQAARFLSVNLAEPSRLAIVSLKCGWTHGIVPQSALC
jgi:hypothetical protein